MLKGRIEKAGIAFRRIAAAFMISAVMIYFAGCTLSTGNGKVSGESYGTQGSTVISTTAGSTSAAVTTQPDQQGKIIADFEKISAGSPKPADLIQYMDRNILSVSRDNASKMVIGLEAAQKKYLPGLEARFYADDMQKELNGIYKPGFDLNQLDSVQNGKFKALLEEMGDSGYRIETAEGMYFPIIDYSFLKKYSTSVAMDIVMYINIMSVESDRVPAKDAAFVIQWEEVLDRAVSMDAFLREYKDSAKLGDMKQIYNKYVYFMLFGLDNTPLFEYRTDQMNPDAKAAYVKVTDGSNTGDFVKMLKDYMIIIEKNGFKLTTEVDQYRQKLGKQYPIS